MTHWSMRTGRHCLIAESKARISGEPYTRGDLPQIVGKSAGRSPVISHRKQTAPHLHYRTMFQVLPSSWQASFLAPLPSPFSAVKQQFSPQKGCLHDKLRCLAAGLTARFPCGTFSYVQVRGGQQRGFDPSLPTPPPANLSHTPAVRPPAAGFGLWRSTHPV